MPTEHYVLTNRPIASLAEWQQGIDVERYPLVLSSIDGSMLSRATIVADLSGGGTRFALKVERPSDVVRPWHQGKVPETWRYAVALGEIGGERSAYAVTLAGFAYAVRSGGVFYDPGDDDAVVSDLGKMRTVLSELLGTYLKELGLRPPAPNSAQ